MRETAGLTQAALAARADLTQPGIARLERGQGARGPGFHIMKRIADACGVELVLGYKVPAATRAANAVEAESAAAVQIEVLSEEPSSESPADVETWRIVGF